MCDEEQETKNRPRLRRGCARARDLIATRVVDRERPQNPIANLDGAIELLCRVLDTRDRPPDVEGDRICSHGETAQQHETADDRIEDAMLSGHQL